MSKLLTKLYQYDFVRNIKDQVRPLKHFILGKDGIYFVVDQIKKARGDQFVKTIFDVGAAFGDTTITFLKSYPEATIYCFEPQKQSFDRLRRRVRKDFNRVKFFNIGLYDKQGFLDFHVASYRDSSSILPLSDSILAQGIYEVDVRKIKVMTLDVFIKKHSVDRIDLIKIDVEGVESALLKGGAETFKNKIDNVFIEISSSIKEINSAEFRDIFDFFYQAGFTFVGCYVDFFFSKDAKVLKVHLGKKATCLRLDGTHSLQ